MAALGRVRELIWARGDAILQADREGFTNEDGFHIVWQFSDTASGPWWMAVREGDSWISFQIDLGRADHRAAFLAGRIPRDVKPR
jgi:hypothetical protein